MYTLEPLFNPTGCSKMQPTILMKRIPTSIGGKERNCHPCRKGKLLRKP